MKIALFALGTILGTILGLLLGVEWESFHGSVMFEGVLKYEPTVDPAITPTYPAGFYVESRVYLENASEELLGKQVVGYGRLGVALYMDAPPYPKVIDDSPPAVER